METQRYAGRTFGGRFAAARVMKDAQGVVTLLGSDTTSGTEVVIKTAPAASLTQATAFRLEHDVRALRDAAPGMFAPVLGGGQDGDAVFVAATYIPGTPLSRRLTGGSLPLSEAVAIGCDLARALRDAHALGVLHRDVQPANVILIDGGRRGVLIGFGLPRLGRLDASIREQPIEDVLYTSPEQAGLIDHEPDERSDLYSLGVVLYTCLAGRPPFTGEDVSSVLREHLSSPAPSLRSAGVAVPGAVDAVVQRLLRKDPRDRYRTADAVLADLTEIADALVRGEDEPDVAVGAHDRRPTIVEPAFIGRTGQLDELEHALNRAVGGRGGVVFVEAPSGAGKTRLLDELAMRSSVRGVRVLRGQGVDQAARRPYQLLTGVAAAAAAAPDLTEALRSRIGDDAADACAALPELCEVLGADGTTTGPEAHAEVRTLRALSSMLDALGKDDRPALVLLDDSQWADDLTVRLLRHWSELDGARHVLVVAAFRSEEVSTRHALREVRLRAHLRPPPFDASDVDRLVESMAGHVPREAAQVVERLSEGSPFMAAAVLRGLVESGALLSTPAGWTVDPDALADVRSSERAATFLTRRLELLPDDALRLLSVGAVLGKSFDLTLAAGLAGLDPSAAIRAVDEARRRSIVWINDRTCAFVHDKLRETLLGRLTHQERTALHAAAAERIERNDPSRLFELAYHFDAAELPTRALPYALQAGAQARAQHALGIAEHQFRIAERAVVDVRDADRSVRLEITRGLGEVLMLQGRYHDAGTYLGLARDLTEDVVGRAQIETRIAELEFKRGDLEASGETAERALRRLGYRAPRGRSGFLFWCVWEIAVQVAHSLAPKLFCGRRTIDPRELLAVRLYSRLAHVYWFGRGSVPTLWTHLREMNLAERYPPTPELAQAYSEHAPVMTLLPAFGRGIEYARRSLEIRRALDDVWGQGQSLNFYGIVHYNAGDHEACIERCSEAVRLLERTGDRWEQNIARTHIAYALLRLGRLREAVEEARRLHADGLEIGDPQAIGIGLEVLSKATGGRIDAEDTAPELARDTRDVQLVGHVAQAEAVRLLGAARPADAVAVLDRARLLIRGKGLKQEYVAPVWPWLVTALRHRAEAETDAPRARTILRTARRRARWARFLARQYRNNLPHALRESGLVAARLGRLRRARRYLDAALAAAERQRLRCEYARTLEARAELGLQVGWPGSRTDLARARMEIEQIRPERVQAATVGGTLSLADRFDTLLDTGRTIARALEPDAILGAVHDAALSLLRGQRCVLLRVRPEGAFVPVGPDTEPGWDAELASRACASGTVVVGDPSGEDPVRSSICAPVAVRGQIVGCIWTGHAEVAGLFGPDEERVAGFIATLAGAAIENAEGFAEIQGFNRTLEARVEERTAQLANANRELDDSLRRLRIALERERDVARKLRELDELKSDFLSTVSHELRTPLTSIQGFAETLLRAWDRLDEPRRLELIERIAQQSRGLGELIFTLLDFSLAERGRFAVQPRPEPLAALIAGSVSRLERQLHAHDVSVLADAGLQVLADRTAFARVFENLMTNAAKFSDPGTSIDVRARRDGDEVAISVRDHGRGIAASELGRVFERFYRVERGDRAPTRGTGIGLAIVKQFVEAQGGRVSVASTVGEGSTFTFTLPAPGPAPIEIGEGPKASRSA